jgi:hypothetical protein
VLEQLFGTSFATKKRRGPLDRIVLSTFGGDTMKSLLACVAGVVLTLSVASSAHAQVFYGRGYYANPWAGVGAYGGGVYNPWTGGAYYGGAGYSPWTGYYSGGRGYSPWTGRIYSRGAFANPYTGTWGYTRSYYNPWTGRYGYRYRYW